LVIGTAFRLDHFRPSSQPDCQKPLRFATHLIHLEEIHKRLRSHFRHCAGTIAQEPLLLAARNREKSRRLRRACLPHVSHVPNKASKSPDVPSGDKLPSGKPIAAGFPHSSHACRNPASIDDARIEAEPSSIPAKWRNAHRRKVAIVDIQESLYQYYTIVVLSAGEQFPAYRSFASSDGRSSDVLSCEISGLLTAPEEECASNGPACLQCPGWNDSSTMHPARRDRSLRSRPPQLAFHLIVC